MRRILSGLMLLLCLQGVAGPRIALIGVGQSGENFADLVLAESGGLEFVERSAIQGVLKERKLLAQNLDANSIPGLSGLLRVAIFAVVEGDPGEMLRVTIFETANGFRLAELLLPPEEAKPERVGAELRRAAGLLQNPQSATLLSFGGVTDLGVPERYTKEAKACAAAVRRQITAIPGILILERDHLSRLRAEHRLTGEFGRLAGAARMVRFQLIPGAAAEQNSCRLQLINANGTVLLEQTRPVTDSAAPETLAASVAKFLKKSPPSAETPQDREKEAARFFAAAEFRTKVGVGQTPETLRLYRTAMELSPTQEHKEALKNNLFSSGTIPAGEIADLLDLLGLNDDDLENPNHVSHYQFLLWQVYTHRNELDAAQLAVVRGLASRIRQTRLQNLRTKSRNMDWRSFSDLSFFLSLSFETIAPCFWFDDQGFYADAEKILEEADRQLLLCSQRSVAPKKGRYDFQSALHGAQRMLCNLPDRSAIDTAERLATRCDAIDHPYLREFSAQMRFHAALRRAGKDREKIRQACRTAISQTSPERDYITTRQTCYLLQDAAKSEKISYNSIFEEELNRCREQSPARTPEELLVEFAREKREADSASMLKLGGSDPACASSFDLLLQGNLSPDTLARLNPDFRFAELLNSANFPILHTDMPPDGMLYYTLSRGGALTLHRFDPSSGKSERLNHIAKVDTNFLLQSSCAASRMQVNDGYAAISEPERILLLPLDGSPSSQIGDWPGKIAGAAVFQGRVWAIGPQLLVSSDLEGKNRTIHLSWQDEHLNELNAIRDAVHGQESFCNLFPEPDAGTLLLLTQYRILRYHPGSGKLEPLPGRFRGDGSRRIGGDISVGAIYQGFNPSAFCPIWKTAERRLVLPVSADYLADAAGVPAEHRIDKRYSLSGPACVQNGLIWTTGYPRTTPSRVMNPAAPERSPFWMYPAVTAFYPHPDGRSVLMVTKNRIVKVTPPEKLP